MDLLGDPAPLVVAAVVLVVGAALVGRRTGIPTPLLLLVVGIGIGFLPQVPAVEVPSELILAGVLPPLLYAAAVTLPVRDVRRNLQPIAGLSVGLVVVTTAAAGGVVLLLLPGLDPALAFALGAVVAPTDAVAATSIAKRLGLPDRLVTVLEGESLVNDATALVLLRTAVAATAGAVSAWGVLGSFAWSVVGGVLVGLLAGLAASWVRARLSDAVLSSAASFAVPFVAYLPAERAGASGVLAVVVAGLVVGHHTPRLDAGQRIAERLNWRTVQFLLEHGVFLAMGLQLYGLVEAVHVDDEFPGVPRALLVAGVLVGLLLLTRGGYVAVMLVLLRRSERRSLARRGQIGALRDRLDAYRPPDDRAARHKLRIQRQVDRYDADLEFLRAEGLGRAGGVVLAWAGMRGVVTLAAAQSLQDGPRELLIVIAFTVSAVTLFGFGGTLGLVIRRSGVAADDGPARKDEVRALGVRLRRASLAVLDDPDQLVVGGARVPDDVVEPLRARYDRAVAALTGQAQEVAAGGDAVTGAQGAEPADGAVRDGVLTRREQSLVLEQRMRAAARAELHDAASVGAYRSSTLATAQDLLDLEDARASRLRAD